MRNQLSSHPPPPPCNHSASWSSSLSSGHCLCLVAERKCVQQQTRRMLRGDEDAMIKAWTAAGQEKIGWLGMCGRHNSNIIIPQFEKKKGMRVRGDKATEEIITNRTNRVYVAVLKETQSGWLKATYAQKEQSSDLQWCVCRSISSTGRPQIDSHLVKCLFRDRMAPIQSFLRFSPSPFI